MVKGKKIREKGKLKLSSYFKKIDDGTRVAISIDKSVNHSLPKRVQGRSGVVLGSRGNSKLIKIKDGNKEKILIVHPIHIKKI
ncbi:MAG: 50S ribosomal protein L21e [Candidatus Pacearchaeota archaeon]